MTEDSVARPALAPNIPPPIEECIEAELDFLRKKRPHLDTKITRASHILVAHMAGRPRIQVIRVRLDSSGRARFLVRSLSESGAIYVVYPGDLSCSCPDYHRSGGICKHGICCFVLMRVAQADRSHGSVIRCDTDGCFVCQNGIVRVVQEYVNEQTGEIKERTMSLPCRHCGGTG